tara:strand:+ start:765 stop:887 length:123 start_codon:yes stop_codon:yes gene_type:complete
MDTLVNSISVSQQLSELDIFDDLDLDEANKLFKKEGIQFK